MNIWLMNHYASNMFRDQAGRHYWFAEELVKRGHKVTVFCANTYLNGNLAKSIKGAFETDYIHENIPFVFVKTNPYKKNGIDRIFNWYNFYRRLIPSAKKYSKTNGKPDVIIASSVHPLTMVAGIKIAKKLKVPCICEIRDLWPEAIFKFGKSREKSLIGRILVKGEHWIYKKADALIFTKEGDTDYLIEKKWTCDLGGDIPLSKCHYINNGIKLDSFIRNVSENIVDDIDLLSKEKFIVVYTGTVRPVNAVGNILDAARIIQNTNNYPNIEFLIYGDGSELDSLKQRVKEERISNVKLKGFIERKYIPFILSKASVNLLNYSQKEYNWTRGNSSNKLFEYMASGKPIISTVKMGYSIINRYNCGFELEECTPECLANKIIDVYNMNPNEREALGNNAFFGSKDFDFSCLTNKLEKVIKGVVKGE